MSTGIGINTPCTGSWIEQNPLSPGVDHEYFCTWKDTCKRFQLLKLISEPHIEPPQNMKLEGLGTKCANRLPWNPIEKDPRRTKLRDHEIYEEGLR